ncbi:hypothetical protein EYS14_14290 [Alteromonadaceae bacterium M269]|nr:hypothetical protein EYS14_14290 [Alteromonadaceae bacterium M269]
MMTVLAGCVSKPEEIPPTEHYTSRVNSDGKLEFAYGLSWKPEAIPRERGGRSRRPPASVQRDLSLNSLPATGEWKLRMEELAVKQLADKFAKEGICFDGHTIEDITWARDRIRLLGKCK